LALSFLCVGHITQSPTVLLDQVVTEGNISLLFDGGVESGLHVALLFVE
jgi:isopentenyl diphosphate isomerase/L-lactate dehydrogenase-like FMN-dependent dehydrogenase